MGISDLYFADLNRQEALSLVALGVDHKVSTYFQAAGNLVDLGGEGVRGTL